MANPTLNSKKKAIEFIWVNLLKFSGLMQLVLLGLSSCVWDLAQLRLQNLFARLCFMVYRICLCAVVSMCLSLCVCFCAALCCCFLLPATRRMRNLFAYDDRHCVKINERQLKAFGNVIKSVMCTEPTTIVTTNNNNQS